MKTLTPLGEEYFISYVSRMIATAPWDILLAVADNRIKFKFSNEGFSLFAKDCVTSEEHLYIKNWIQEYILSYPIDKDGRDFVIDSLFIH